MPKVTRQSSIILDGETISHVFFQCFENVLQNELAPKTKALSLFCTAIVGFRNFAKNTSNFAESQSVDNMSSSGKHNPVMGPRSSESKKEVECGLCPKYKARRDWMKGNHFPTVHPGQPYLEKGQQKLTFEVRHS